MSTFWRDELQRELDARQKANPEDFLDRRTRQHPNAAPLYLPAGEVDDALIRLCDRAGKEELAETVAHMRDWRKREAKRYAQLIIARAELAREADRLRRASQTKVKIRMARVLRDTEGALS